MSLWKIYNGAAPTTAALVKVTTGTVIKTMLQVKLLTGTEGRVVEWGASFFGSAAGTPVQLELIETGTVFATVTAHAAAGIVALDRYDGPAPDTNLFEVGTSATGYTSTAEGSITASRLLDAQGVAPTNQHILQFPLGYHAGVNDGTSLRIRVTTATAYDMYCYVVMEV